MKHLLTIAILALLPTFAMAQQMLYFGLETQWSHTVIPPIQNPPEVFPELFADEYGNVWRKVPCAVSTCMYYDGRTWQPCECQCAELVRWIPSFKALPVVAKPVFSQSKYQGA